MTIHYPVSEILRCVDHINDPEKEIYESLNEVLVLRNLVTMEEDTKKKERMSLEPFQIEEITKVEDSKVKENIAEKDVMVLTEEVTEKVKDKYSITMKAAKKQDSKEIKILNEQVEILRKHNEILENDLKVPIKE